MDAKEQELFTLINSYRQEKGLPAIKPSVNLAYVAHTHAIDVVENDPDVNGGNMHSWSDKGMWKPVIYTSDHAQAALMWSKPSEISNYKSAGYEISYAIGNRKTSTVDPTYALNAWKASSGHNDVIVQQGIWKDFPMKALGVGIYKGYACAWFGFEEDTYPPPG
ncbi:unnamed protein product [Rotaria sordida]|uniref:SCP domain-containing protein n=1 Tax=Rotaria sordida TaxID=392033 RepID=A0A815PWY4_9BILA|nr:unnamed protein product [Rotaria sordida]CAF1442882.1 unnamed protein product [Rotaria sordida]CAF1455608.1 unnamed protein product [Rotaria sordida]CAF3772050.1 unnamed protein product [Rotaria sordida]